MRMEERLLFFLSLNIFLILLFMNLGNCWCLNSEGVALLRFRESVKRDPFGALLNWRIDDDDPCSWSGVGCHRGRVVILNLKDRCLEGTISPELGALHHIRFLILRNNSFSGTVPREIGKLKELEVMDLGYNNLSGPLPSELGSSLEILLLNNNNFLDNMSPKLHDLSMRSMLFMGENLSDALLEASQTGRLTRRYINEQAESAGNRRLMQNLVSSSTSNSKRNQKDKQTRSNSKSPSPAPSVPQQSSRKPSSPSIAMPPSPDDNLHSTAPAPTPMTVPSPPASARPNSILPTPPPASVPLPSPSASPQSGGSDTNRRKSIHMVTYSAIIGASVLFSSLAIFFFFCRTNKGGSVRPWATGLSGQLQKAFVTGVPSLKRAELETACEDFSNIIGTSSDSTLYKGTLSSGVEIAVISSAVTSAKDWSKQAEDQFRKKIDTLSKMNHKNFVNLLGYCEEKEPFTRMMVFEYAPNGTLFEHLHIKEAEHLDWGMRMRIVMGMVYCLEHMHQMNPPVVHTNLNSTTIYLTDDYAAKVSDFGSWNNRSNPTTSSTDSDLPDNLSPDVKSNVYSFGVIMLEMLTGKLPYSEEEVPLVERSLDYLRGIRPIGGIMDPTLKSFQEEEASALCSVILSCVNPNPNQRPTMREVTARLRQITSMAPDGATPRLSPLWWAELEILSSVEAS